MCLLFYACQSLIEMCNGEFWNFIEAHCFFTPLHYRYQLCFARSEVSNSSAPFYLSLKSTTKLPKFLFRFLQCVCDAGLRRVPLENPFYGFLRRSSKLHYIVDDLFCIISGTFNFWLLLFFTYRFLGNYNATYSKQETECSGFLHNELVSPLNNDVCIPKQTSMFRVESCVALLRDCPGLGTHWLTRQIRDISSSLQYAIPYLFLFLNATGPPVAFLSLYMNNLWYQFAKFSILETVGAWCLYVAVSGTKLRFQ